MHVTCADCSGGFEYVRKYKSGPIRKFCDDCSPHRRRQARHRSDKNNPEARRERDRRWYRQNPESHKESQRRWNAKNVESIRQWHAAHHRKKKYGLLQADMDALIAAQSNACAICASEFGDGVAMNVDHDHATGVVRALLCQPCNAGLGLFREDPTRLQGAILYLQEHKGVRPSV